MVLATLASSVLAIASPNVELIGAAVEKLEKGEDPYSLDGVIEKSQEIRDSLPDLSGCVPSLGSDSSRKYVQVDFLCEDPQGSYGHRVSFSEAGNGQLSIYVDPIPARVGPTSTALSRVELPSKNRQFRSLIKAIKNDEDPTLGGLIPLTNTQMSELSKLADCDWISPRRLGRNRQKLLSVVTCVFFERNKAKMVEIQFDEADHALLLRISNGTTSVRRP